MKGRKEICDLKHGMFLSRRQTRKKLFSLPQLSLQQEIALPLMGWLFYLSALTLVGNFTRYVSNSVSLIGF